MAIETKRKKTKICCLDLDTDCLNLLNKRFDVYDHYCPLKMDGVKN